MVPRPEPGKKNIRIIAALDDGGIKTQKKLSERTGVNKTIINQIINNIRNPSEQEKKKIATALKKKPKDLW